MTAEWTSRTMRASRSISPLPSSKHGMGVRGGGDCLPSSPPHANSGSARWCRKAQVVDLQAEGYWEELLDTTQPAIVVKDW